MNQEQLKRFKQQLLQEKADIEHEIEHMEELAMKVGLQDSIDELSFYDNHPADIATEVFERSKDIALRDNMHHQIAKIDDALQLVEQGTYGTCQECGKVIPEERLEAFPSATVCFTCKEKEEALIDRHPRPIEEDVISPPFGGYLHDDAPGEGDSGNLTVFDGEDSWQEVARFGTSETPQDLSTNNIRKFNEMYVDSDEDVGFTEDVDHIAYEKDIEGRIYQDFDGKDDEMNASPFPDLLQRVERGEKIYLNRSGNLVQAEDEAGHPLDTDTLPRN